MALTYRVRSDMLGVARQVVREWRDFSPRDLLRAVTIIEDAANRRVFPAPPPAFCPVRLRSPRSAPRSRVSRHVLAVRPEGDAVFFCGRGPRHQGEQPVIEE